MRWIKAKKSVYNQWFLSIHSSLPPTYFPELSTQRLRILKCKNKFSILSVLPPTFHSANVILKESILVSHGPEISYEWVGTDGSGRSDVTQTFLC